MANVFEQAQQLFQAELTYWSNQVREYADLMAKETEANLQVAQELMQKGQASFETMVKRGDALRRDVDARTTAFVSKLAEMKAA